jgi:hypothetical protein
MRLVVRRLKEGTFFRSPSLWVKSLKEATQVDSLESALRHLEGEDLSELELVVLSDEGYPGVGFSISDLVKDPNK